MLTEQQKKMIANPRLSQVRAATILARKLRQAGRPMEDACLHAAKVYDVSYEAVRLFADADPEPRYQNAEQMDSFPGDLIHH